MIYWTASNNSSFLNGLRREKTLIGAVRAARKYIRGELYGEGTASFYENSDGLVSGTPIRIDSKTMFTGYRWEVSYPQE